MESREEILANFQACTGIEDIGEALQHLEDSGWVLHDAINRAIPEAMGEQAVDPVAQRPNSPLFHYPPLDPQPIVIPDDDPPSLPHINPSYGLMESLGMRAGPSRESAPSLRPALASDFLPLGSSQRSRLLELNVTYKERMIQLNVPDSETIQTVKDLLHVETSVPPCQQELRGWSSNSPFPPTDRRLLSELSLPKENFLCLLTPDIPATVLSDLGENEVLPPVDITLNIHDLFNNKKYSLPFKETACVGEVKREMYSVTNIPVYRQEWTGWPANSQNHLSLAQCGVVNNQEMTVTQPDTGMPIVVRDDEEDEVSEDEYQDVPEHMEDEDIFVSQPARSGIHPLLPENIEDETMAGIQFGEEFANRYGQPSLPFFPGSLDAALTDTCGKSTAERKMLAIYLHHDSSVLTNVFCTQVLCADAVIGLLLENFVTWGWDLTFQSNKQRLLDMINRHFGSIAASTLRNFDVEKFPLVILVAKLRGNLEILRIIHGNTTLAEFMTELLSSAENYNQQEDYWKSLGRKRKDRIRPHIGLEKREEEERNERNYMKEEQERAFQEAQILDQVKEREREDAEAEAKLQEQIDEAKRRSEIEAKEEEERRRRDEQDAAKEILPAEPSVEDPRPQANIRFRTPRETLNRRFLADETLGTILLYLASVGYRPSEYKILASWPRRDISVLSNKSSLAELKLCPQETLTLEATQSAESDSE